MIDDGGGDIDRMAVRGRTPTPLRRGRAAVSVDSSSLLLVGSRIVRTRRRILGVLCLFFAAVASSFLRNSNGLGWMELVESEEVEEMEAAVQYYTAVVIYYLRRIFGSS